MTQLESLFNFDAHNLFNDIFLGDLKAYPHYNIKYTESENKLVIELALSGFKKEELSVTLDGGYLAVSGTKEDTDSYLHKGISTKSFTKKFLVKDAKIEYARFENGVLTIKIFYETPEEKKLKLIEIL